MKAINERLKRLLFFIIIVLSIFCYTNKHRIFLNFFQVESPFVKEVKQQYQTFGKGIKIAIVDTGLNTNHKEFQEKSVQGYDFSRSSNLIVDELGHGTWVAGIIAAEDNNFGIRGIAPSSTIVPLCVFDEHGNCCIEMVCEAISWCICHHVDLINISLSTQNDDLKLHESIDKAISAGIIVIASYSNKEDDCSYPADYEGVIGVKSHESNTIYRDNGIWYAPGQDMLTTSKEGGYKIVSGNSIAAAVVTGYIALIMEKCRNNNTFFDPEQCLTTCSFDEISGQQLIWVRPFL